jgi:hypothetical protein
MRPSSSIPSRSIWALLALVQLVATVGAPVADGALDSGTEGVAHVESEAGAECGVHHDHLFCQNGRSVALEAQQGSGTCEVLAPPRTVARLSASAADLPSPSPRLSRPLGSRAPPRG